MAENQDLKMDGKTLDITKENIAAMKQLFPEIVTDGKIDFEKLRLILGDEVETSDERYNFTWHGKNQAIRLSQTPSMGTLRPCKEDSVNWDTTKNLYIEGDNLEVLKLLQRSYFGRIKMIYIDPPYNTGRDFIYNDNFVDNIKNYKEIVGEIDSDGNSMSTLSSSDGRFHTKWLNMMISRLRLARNLLSDDGVICISIDDGEIANLRKICDEIFGETNFIAQLIWKKKAGGGSDSRYVAIDHEYILVYARDESVQIKWSMPLNEEQRSQYKLRDSNYDKWGPYKLKNLYQTGIDSNRPNLRYPIRCPDGSDLWPPTIWRWSRETLDEALANNEIEFVKNKDGEWSVFTKMYLNKGDSEYEVKPRSIIVDGGFTRDGNKQLASMLKDGVFDYPKPVQLIKLLTSFISKNDGDIILDFFGGSATTAQSILELNSEDGVSRNFIIVQLPENLDHRLHIVSGSAKSTVMESISFLDSINKPHFVSEIGKERIRRVLSHLSKNNQTTLDNLSNTLDLGFRNFKLDSSNLKKWSSTTDVRSSLIQYEENIISDSTREELDIVYEIILKLGLSLSSSVDHIDKIYSVESGTLMICLDVVSDLDVAKGMISLHDKCNPLVWKVVFRDNGFASDDIKANTRETLKMAGLQDGSFITL